MIPLRIRNNPFQRIGDSYGHFFDPHHFMGRSAFEDSWLTKPLANIIKNENGYYIRVRVPGFAKEEIEMQLEDHILTIHAEKEPEDGHEIIHEEASQYKLMRSFELVSNVDAENITAHLDKGILSIFLPLEKDKHVSKAIKIT